MFGIISIFRKYLINIVLRITALAAMLAAAVGCAPDPGRELQEAFANPPQEAKPVIIWQWMDGWVTKEGITAELSGGRSGPDVLHPGGLRHRLA